MKNWSPDTIAAAEAATQAIAAFIRALAADAMRELPVEPKMAGAPKPETAPDDPKPVQAEPEQAKAEAEPALKLVQNETPEAVTLDDLRRALSEASKAVGSPEPFKAIVLGFGVPTITKLDPSQYAAVLEAVRAKRDELVKAA